MPVLRRTIRRVSALVPERWKRRLRTALFEVPDTEASLRRMQRLGFNPATVIDVGAYVGEWTRSFKQIFPHARILMVEPQPTQLAHVRDVAAEFDDVEFAPVLLGPEEREKVVFHCSESASSVLMEGEAENIGSNTCLTMTTLDAVAANTRFAEPDFIKLDVQGYELEVLKGAERSLRSAEAVLMEVNLLGIYEGAPLFHEAARFMSERGFQVYDICTFFRRPYDGALWQVGNLRS